MFSSPTGGRGAWLPPIKSRQSFWLGYLRGTLFTLLYCASIAATVGESSHTGAVIHTVQVPGTPSSSSTKSLHNGRMGLNTKIQRDEEVQKDIQTPHTHCKGVRSSITS